jgi:hypothetical protein
MSQQQLNWPTYPTDVWEYLQDMPNMPSREDRDKLVRNVDQAENAVEEQVAQRRVRIWDYFFRLQTELLGKPQKSELAKIESGLAEIQNIQRQLAEQRKRTEEEVRRRMVTSRKKRRQVGIALFAIGITLFLLIIAVEGGRGSDEGVILAGPVLVLGGILALTNLGDPSQTKIEGEVNKIVLTHQLQQEGRIREIIASLVTPQDTTAELSNVSSGVASNAIEIERQAREELTKQNGIVLGSMIFGGVLLLVLLPQQIWCGVICTAIGILGFAVNKGKPSEQQVAQLVQKRLGPDIQNLKKNLQTLDRNITVQEYSQHIGQRAKDLRTQIATLVAQVPPPPSDAQVATWLDEDIESLREKAITECGFSGRTQHLDPIANGKNPLHLFGPAELQPKENIPQHYHSGDRLRHLRARKFTEINGENADFYGVYYIEFILIAKDQIASYGTFYDFIVGKPFSDRARTQHYIDIVAVEIRRSYREIEIDDHEKLEMDSVPSLSFTLPSSERIEVTYPSKDYYNHFVKNSARPWRSDLNQAADNAGKILRKRVDDAKQLRREKDSD